MLIRHHNLDLTDLSIYSSVNTIAVDSESLGLNIFRDRLCLIQLSPGDGTVDIIKIKKNQKIAPNLKKIFQDTKKTKIFHFARFDLAAIKYYLNIDIKTIWCTKIASKLSRTYTDNHSLQNLLLDLLNIEISKKYQKSNWSISKLENNQIEYAANDVIYLHRLQNKLINLLKNEDRLDIAYKCFNFLPTRVDLDLLGWRENNIFSHS